MSLARVRSTLKPFVDPLLALAVFGLGFYEIWIESGQVSGPQVGNTAFLLLVSVPLAWRRRHPLAVLAIVTLGSIGWSYAWYFEHQPPVAPFIALLLAVYAVAASAAGQDVVVGTSLVAAFIVAEFVAVVAGSRPAADSGAGWVFLALDWSLGRVVHRHRALAAALAERASQLEHERDENARLAATLERARIARELHDVVTHNVSVMVVQAGVERRTIGESDPAREVLSSIEEIGRATLVELRRLVGVLRKGDGTLPLAPQPTLARLDDLVEQAGQAGLPVELRIEGECKQLPAGVELSAYRIVQEALTNVLKHAGSARATVVVLYAGETLALEITDDGHGPRDGSERGHGLLGMHERVALHGGTLETAGRNGGGFVVRARLPVTGS